jgi:hypothetical protein
VAVGSLPFDDNSIGKRLPFGHALEANLAGWGPFFMSAEVIPTIGSLLVTLSSRHSVVMMRLRCLGASLAFENFSELGFEHCTSDFVASKLTEFGCGVDRNIGRSCCRRSVGRLRRDSVSV